MIRILLTAICLSCLFLPVNLAAEPIVRDPEEATQLRMTLNEYRNEGYEWYGPLQYLGRSQGKVEFYRHRPISYRTLDMKDEKGDRAYIKEYEFVYALSKHGHVVLIRVDRDGCCPGLNR